MTEDDLRKQFERIKDLAMKMWEMISKPDENGRTPLDRLADALRGKLEDAKTIVTPEALKIAMEYQEFNKYELTWDKLLAFVKNAYSLKPGMGICILKNKTEMAYSFDIMAIDENKNIMSSPTAPWCHITVIKPVEILEKFGDKSMIVMK